MELRGNITAGLTDVIKLHKTKVIKFLKVVGLLPCFSQAEEAKPMVSEEILDVVSFAR